MITLDKTLLSPDLLRIIENLNTELCKFRNEGELDQLSKEKLKEYFRTQHIFHSAGIEGNRLTLQETMLVLKEGITISEKSIQDTVEVKNLGIAFDFFYELAQENTPITENYIKQMHQLVVGNDLYVNAGNYRNVGVVITGSEHTPPEPFEVPFKMQELIAWLNENFEHENPVILAAVIHHEMAKIHPFADGNGRTARLLLNLILMKQGYPICSIKRTERPRYYQAMTNADKGNYHEIVELVAESCAELLAVYVRIREESNRKTQFIKKWGSIDIEGKLRKEKNKFELWLNKTSQIKLEFRQFVDLLNENLYTYHTKYSITYYEYPSMTFDVFQELTDENSPQKTFFFAIRFVDKESKKSIETFVFSFLNHFNQFSDTHVIAVELNCYHTKTKSFVEISQFQWAEDVQLRYFYFNESHELIIGSYDKIMRKITEQTNVKLPEIIATFFDNIRVNVLNK